MHDKARSLFFGAFLGLGAACGDDGTGGGDAGGGGGGGVELDPAPGGLRRLTEAQYVASVRVLFGEVAAAAAEPPDDQQFEGSLAIAAAELPLTPAEVDAYERSAIAVAAAAVADPQNDDLLACPSFRLRSECFESIADRVGRLAWRRVLDPEEQAEIAALGDAGWRTLGGFEDGVRVLLAGLLQSPNFLYQVELGDESASDGVKRPLLPHELASRLSFFLVGQTPDEALLDLAEAGELETAEQIHEVARELVASPRAKEALSDFFDARLKLGETTAIQKDPALFPLFTDATRAALATETRLFLEEIFWAKDADALSMFDAPFTFVNEDNAWIYGLTVTGAEFERVELEGRAGLITQPSFLARNAHAGETSPTMRGRWILEELLCQSVQPPPPGTVAVLPELTGGHKTMRQRLEEVIQADTSCAVCHDRMDPLGLALEHFDAAGRHRVDDLGLPIDAHGEVVGLAPFDGATSLAASVRAADGAARCLVRQLYRHSMGHKEGEGELTAIAEIESRFAADGRRMRELLVSIATSPAFRFVGAPK